jgi:hypothetical protein
VAPFAGAVSVGASPQFLSIDHAVDQPETAPEASTERTRHQYVPFGSVLSSVARVFSVKNDA